MIKPTHGWIRLIQGLAWILAFLLLCLLTIWAAAALYFDLPSDLAPSVLVAIFFLITVVALLFSLRFSWFALGFGFALFAAVALWCWSIKPPKTRDWQPDVAQTGDYQVPFHFNGKISKLTFKLDPEQLSEADRKVMHQYVIREKD
jgi:energy-coupling factor transporter transmembrane protein EcfT